MKVTTYVSMVSLLLLAIEAHAVVGGIKAVYPNVALLENWQPSGVVGICTGTWIGPRALLTAAHCGSDGDRIRISPSDSPEPGSAYPFYSLMGVFHPHPDYNSESHALDVAIIETEAPHPSYFSDFPLSSGSTVQPGEWAFIAGYGCTSRINNTGYMEPHAAATKVLSVLDQEIRTKFSQKKTFFRFLALPPNWNPQGAARVILADRFSSFETAHWSRSG